jgi:hypothetical protein
MGVVVSAPLLSDAAAGGRRVGNAGGGEVVRSAGCAGQHRHGLETSRRLGTPCANAAGIDLGGWLKLYLKTAGLRVIYAIVREPTDWEPKSTDEQGLVDVLAIGPRSDLSAYIGAEDELRRLGRHRSQRGRR